MYIRLHPATSNQKKQTIRGPPSTLNHWNRRKKRKSQKKWPCAIEE